MVVDCQLTGSVTVEFFAGGLSQDRQPAFALVWRQRHVAAQQPVRFENSAESQVRAFETVFQRCRAATALCVYRPRDAGPGRPLCERGAEIVRPGGFCAMKLCVFDVVF